MRCYLKSWPYPYPFPSSYHSFINPIVNPADILPVRGIPKLVIANHEDDDDAAAAWPSALLIPGICIIAFESVVIAPSDTV
jgi:hypothetical protein